MSAIVRYIANGFTISAAGGGVVMPSGPADHYAATIPEVIYWLAIAFEPAPASLAARIPSATSEPRALDPTDPLIGQEAAVWPLVSGGYIVRQMPHLTNPLVDQWCVSLDDVHGVLNLIFSTPPAPLASSPASPPPDVSPPP
jgi:hypothetical protein